jgi:hypothetical protein
MPIDQIKSKPPACVVTHHFHCSQCNAEAEKNFAHSFGNQVLTPEPPPGWLYMQPGPGLMCPEHKVFWRVEPAEPPWRGPC